MFLFRAIFWLSLVILLLPADPRGEAPRVTAFEALLAARATVADLAEFCGRNPAVCETGGEVVDVMADKVRYNAERLYEYVSKPGRTTPDPAMPPVPAAGTLTGDDLTIPWRAPGAV